MLNKTTASALHRKFTIASCLGLLALFWPVAAAAVQGSRRSWATHSLRSPMSLRSKRCPRIPCTSSPITPASQGPPSLWRPMSCLKVLRKMAAGPTHWASTGPHHGANPRVREGVTQPTRPAWVYTFSVFPRLNPTSVTPAVCANSTAKDDGALTAASIGTPAMAAF